MKNIYNDKEMPDKERDISSGRYDNQEAVVRDKATSAPVQPAEPQPQPQPVQFQQPVYFVPGVQTYPQFYPVQPYPPQGIPAQGVPVQLSPEQMAAYFPQYPPQPQPQYVQPQYTQPQYVQPQPQVQEDHQPQADSGMRVLYQSDDFDKPARMEQESYDDDFELPDPEGKSFSDREALDIEIEEETISFSPANSKKAGTMKVEEMEMSTFELNSILSRQSKGKAKDFSGQNVVEKEETPIKFGASFKIEETVDEVMDDISSDMPSGRKKKLSTAEIIRRCILGISIPLIIISAGMLFNEYRLSRENDKIEEGVSDLIITSVESNEKENDAQTTTKKKKKDKKETTTTVPLTPEQQWAQLQAEYPNLVFPMGLQLKYARLYATNQDFVGYLEAKGVNLSLPVVQADNDEYYLERNFYGKATKYGCPFVTHVNNIVDLDQNTIIFGHHMNNGTVFGALDAYKSIEGFKKAPVITFNTLYKDYSWKVIAAFITNAYEKQDNGYVFRYYFASLSTQDRFAAYLNELSQRSIYDTGVDVLPTDKLLTLSTCSHEFDEARFVVVARLVRPGESADVDVSAASVNPSPRYPQAFYDKKKLDNPYVNASRWEVG